MEAWRRGRSGGRPPLAASSLQNPTQLRCFRAERGHGRFGVVTWASGCPSFPAVGQGVSGAGYCCIPHSVSGVRVTPLQSPPQASGCPCDIPDRRFRTSKPYLASRREGPVHVKQAEDALLPAGALSGHSHVCSSASPAEFAGCGRRAASRRH